MYCDKLLLSLIYDTHETDILTSSIYISKYLLRSLGLLMYSSFTVFWILIQKVLIRLLPYLTYKFNINERVDVNQDGPSLIIEA